MFPNTDAVYQGEVANAAVEIADNMSDLQVALGIDLDADGVVEDTDEDGVQLATNADEWQFNDEEETDPDDLLWAGAPLHFVRLTTLGHTRSPDRQYVSPAIEAIENHVYGEVEPPPSDELVSRRYRRRLLQNVIDMRNL
jgi:hypothetical protein